MSPLKSSRREDYKTEVLKMLAPHGLGIDKNVYTFLFVLLVSTIDLKVRNYDYWIAVSLLDL